MEKDLKKSETQIYGSFFLNGDEFALSAKCIQEVVNVPERFTPMPLAPSYLLGVFNLRGVIIPVIDLKPLLGMPTGSIEMPSRKVAIIDHDGVKVGLCFDQTGEIIRSRDEERSEFESGKVVFGALKLDEGKRIIQLLSPNTLVHLESIPRPAVDDSMRNDRARRSRGDRKQCISFLVGESRCAFGIDSIHEIIRVPEIKESALSGNLCIGILEVRGDIIPIVDFAVVLGFREKAKAGEGDDRRIIVMKMGDEKFGLLIDSVESIITFYSEELLGIPVLGKKKSGMFLGCISRPDFADVILLSTAEVLSVGEIEEITHGHSKIYQSQKKTKESLKKGVRNTYITFTLDSLIGIGIQEIREIIDLPKDMLHPPGLPKHVKGMLNLRGEIVAIVDARTLYEMPANENGQPPKVLVFEKMNVKYGLIVDSVENILSIVDSESLRLPEALYKGNGGFSQDVQQLVEVVQEGQKKTLMILDLGPVAERIGLAAA